MPLTLEPQVQAMKNPVAMSQLHHSTENSLWQDEHIYVCDTVDLPVTQFTETYIRVNGEGHEEYENGIEKNESRL